MSFTRVLCLLVPALSFAQGPTVDLKKEEAAIRALIGKGQAKPTDDAIFWSGAFKRPTVGAEKGDAFPSSSIGKRKNQVITNDIHRIEVASSGDMAYDFSYGKLEYDVDDPPSAHHESFQTALLRVWKKINGEWRVAATFVRPLDVPFGQ